MNAITAPFDLNLEVLEDLEAPLTDMEWGVLSGLALIGGVAIGIAIVT
jgi:hypothetical protein